MALLLAKTELGTVEGLPAGNQAVSLFKGIPFAAPPVGELRWQPPKAAKPWEGIFKAYKFAPIPMQFNFSPEGSFAAKDFYVIQYPMSEDCLYLNVWTPAKREDEKLPVAVYIHGGGYSGGFSYLQAYDGEPFAKRGMVLVTIAYRVNVFGFLAHKQLQQESGTTGNYGILDQIAALKWVRRNIAAFGGDPENIGVFGQSAGGMSIQTLCASPLAKGLFDRAIIQSGGGMYPMDLGLGSFEKACAQGEDFFEYMGVKTATEARALSSEKVLDSMLSFNKNKYRLNLGPTIDGNVLPATQDEMFRRSEHPDIPYMTGCMQKEDGGMGFRRSMPDIGTIKAQAKEQYGDAADKYLAATKPEDPDYYTHEILECGMANGFLAGTLALCELQNELGRRPAYMYYFTLVPPGAEDMGAHHSAEHHYVFQTLNRSTRPYTGWDWDLSNELCNMWANFLKTGDPNGAGLPEWKPYTKAEPKALIIGKERKMDKVYEKPFVSFLKNYLLKRV